MASTRSLSSSVPPPEDAQDQLKKMKAAERARAYRERRRNDTQHKEKERQRKKEYRARMKESISNDEILRQREMSRIRQKRFNENKKRKLEGEGETEAVKPARAKKAITRRESLKQREYWRAKKREQRANMTSQKKRRIREKERARYAKRKQSLAPCTTFAETTTTSDSYTAPTESPSLLSSAATKQRAYRLKKNIPKTPEKFAQVMGHILLNSTPRQKTCLRRIGISSSPRKEEAYRYSKSIIETIRSIKEKRQQKWLAVKRCLITSIKSTRKARNYKKMSEATGLSYRALKKYTHDDLSDLTSYQRKRRQDCLTEETIEQVKSHYEASASFVPDIKAVSKKTFKSQKVLDRPLARIYESFKSKHPDIDISQSKFSTLRPANVKTSKHQRLYQSMCEYCTNSKLKMQAINTVSERLQIQDCKLREIDDFVDLTTCKKMEGSEYHEKKCLTRDCDDCGVDGLDKFYGALIAATEREEDKVSWKHWSNVQYCQPGKRPSTRKTLLTKSTNLVELKDALKKDVASLSEHLLNAYWQKNCFQTLSKRVPKDSIVVHMDFSENYSTFYQQEISSAHWMKNLVTVHPSVAFYTCPDCGDTAKPVMDVLVFLSDDTNHDHHAVQTFVEETVRFLKEDRHLNFKNMYEFTDGCSSQYKSRGPFVDISYGMSDFEIQRERFFFGSCHGKGPCDGAGGVVKTATRMAVIRGEAVITDATTMYNHLKMKLTRIAKIQNVCNHSRREFFLVDIKRDRPDRTVKAPLKGTRKVHSIRGISPGVVHTRTLGCACSYCITGEGDVCNNMEYVGEWSEETLRIPGQRGRPERRGTGRGVRTRGGRKAAPAEPMTDSGTQRGARRAARGSRGGRGVRTRGGGRGVRTPGGGRCVARPNVSFSEDSDTSISENLMDMSDSDSMDPSLDIAFDDQEVNSLEDSDDSNVEPVSVILHDPNPSLDQEVNSLEDESYVHPASMVLPDPNPSLDQEVNSFDSEDTDELPLGDYVSDSENSLSSSLSALIDSIIQKQSSSSCDEDIKDGSSSSCDEDIIDGFAIVSFKTVEDLEQHGTDCDSCLTTTNVEIDDARLEDQETNGTSIPGIGQQQTLSMSYQDGAYIIVQHGTEKYPAVVDGWPWVRFFKRKRGQTNHWEMQETRHVVVLQDVAGLLQPPELVCCGSRFLYAFEDF
ncbi:uncharacterized protein LOC127833585 [Dreissena polymorpha]|uniref:uncharacterized protein LOC127833585 n=1 Tax=Dreissena polymorpha TaxID=45954 RepID=UPI0022651285|nr:uncharacterized protein LOC127833585 [Dreissena polymorpha]